MPELPEVEILTRHLQETLPGRRIEQITIHRERSIRPHNPADFKQSLLQHRFHRIRRRAKFLLFTLSANTAATQLIGHLGMTGRMYLQPQNAPLPKHAAVVMNLNRGRFVFDDPRVFGRMTLDPACLDRLGPEPLSETFQLKTFRQALQRSRRPIHTALLAQDLVAGLGNIYACETLFQAGIHPQTPSCQLAPSQTRQLRRCIQTTLAQAIQQGSTLPLNLARKTAASDNLFYFGRKKGAQSGKEQWLVYGRENAPCCRCSGKIQRIIQTARSAYFCPNCQSQQKPAISI